MSTVNIYWSSKVLDLCSLVGQGRLYYKLSVGRSPYREPVICQAVLAEFNCASIL